MIASSLMLSISPRPNVGVGIRKEILFSATIRWKSGWPIWQLPASLRPLIVKRPCTPPSGLLVTLSLASTANLNRASRTGPVRLINCGTEFVAPSALATAIWGFTLGLVPPTEGWAWQLEQELELNEGPRPLFFPF